MMSFMDRFGTSIRGAISGFDRLVFRGHLQSLMYPGGMLSFLSAHSVLLKEFMPWAQGITARLRDDFSDQIVKVGQEVEYIGSPSTEKEPLARRRQSERSITEGVIAAFACVEPCRTWTVHKNRTMKRLVPAYGPGQCKHLYRYLDHPRFGVMHVRLQTWFPFTIQVCMNGREFLRRSMGRAHLGFTMRDNCFTDIAQWPRAQSLMDGMLDLNWIDVLDGFAQDVFPSRRRLLGNVPYRWSVFQSEWATDYAFASTAALDAIYPSLVQHALMTSDTAAVLRFLGKRITKTGEAHGKFDQEVTSRRAHRVEGICVKHHVGRNSAKFYNKQGSVFRAEATLNDPSAFKIYRETQGGGRSKSWLPMRASVVDIKRRAEVSHQINHRLLDHLAAVTNDQPLERVIDGISQTITWKGEQIRGLDLLGKDRFLIDLLANPANAINGIRNRDIASALTKEKRGRGKTIQQRSGMATRLLRLLRAHGLIKKVPRTHRYQLSDQGLLAIHALKSALSASADKLIKLAA